MPNKRRFKLLPCPFCGNKTPTLNRWQINGSYFVMCGKCPVKMEDLIEDKHGISKPVKMQQAIKAWNSRDYRWTLMGKSKDKIKYIVIKLLSVDNVNEEVTVEDDTGFSYRFDFVDVRILCKALPRRRRR